MKKHLRLFAIFAATVSLVGVMAGAALAAASASDISVSATSVTLNYGDTTTGVTLILHNSNASDAATVTATQTAIGTVTAPLTITASTSVAKGADANFKITCASNTAVGKTKVTLKVGDATVKTIDVEILPITPEFLTSSTVAADADFATMCDASYKKLYGGNKYSTQVGKTVIIQFNSGRWGKYGYTVTSTSKNAPAFPKTAITETKDASFTGGKGKVTYTFAAFDAPAVTEDTDYTLTFTASDGEFEIERNYDFTVYAAPTITNDATKEPKAKIVWGDTKGWEFEVKGTNVDKFTAADIAKYFTSGTKDTYLGLTFTDGTFAVDSSAFGGTWKPGSDYPGVFSSTWNGADVTKEIKVTANRGELVSEKYPSTVEKTFKFVFQGVAPKFVQAADTYTFTYNTDIEADKSKNIIVVEAPGTIKVAPDSASTKALTALGIKLEEDTTSITPDDVVAKTYKVLKFTGKPSAATKGTKITITAQNPYSKKNGKDTVFSTTIVVETEEVKFTDNSKSAITTAATGLPKNMVVGDKVNITLEATPAPLAWKPTNLPAGLKLTPNTKEPTKATLSGTLTTATKDLTSDKNHWTITATNSDFKDATAAVLSGDLIVWAKPTFKTDPSKVIAVKTGDGGVKVSIVPNFPVSSKDWQVGIYGTNTDNLVKDGEPTSGVNMTADVASLAGTAVVTVDKDTLQEKGILTLSGSFDRVPNGGKNIPLSVTMKVPGRSDENTAVNTITKTFNLKVTGVAPKFAKADWDAGEATTYTLDPTAGTPPITLTAEIDKNTASKVFGKSAAIKLTAEANDDTGLKFEDAADDVKDGTGNFTYDSSKKDVAFKKLPITVTASNKDVSAKDTTFKVTVTREGTDPAWIIGAAPAETLHPAGDDKYAENDKVTDKYSSKINYNVEAKKALGDGLVLKATGSFPLNASVKPESKNGITAKIGKVSDNDPTPTVTFSGTPSDVKKDTATKFTVELTNPSTGKKDKVDVTFTTLPTPTLASTTITAKPVVWGKAVKVQPKLTATNKNVTWLITGISSDKTYDATSTQQTNAAQELSNTYGLDFDSAKGTISGTTAYATGKSAPLEVKIKASGDLSQSAEATVKITVLGEPVKLTTKTVPFSLGDNKTEVETSDAMKVSTNLDGATETNRANVEWTFKAPSEIKSLNLTESTGNAPGVYATASRTDENVKVTKKAQTEITFTNYDTVTKGKLAFTVDGATPALNSPTMPIVKYGTSKTVKLSVSNNSLLSEKLKWKVSTKPSVKGVTASVKAGTKGTAVLTLKVGPKVTDSSASVGITVTDSLTKKESEEGSFEFTIDPYTPPEDSSAEAPLVADKPEAVTETKEDVTSDKTLGEGTVKLGSARTAEGLTSAQRAAIEDKGYVIAAVLPEVEVEDASGAYVLEVGELDEAAATGAELVYFAFASKPTTDDEYAIFANAEDGAETTVIPESRKVTVEAWLNVGTKYAPVIAVKANAAAAEAKTEEDVKAKAEEKAEEAKEESKEDSAKTETKEVKE